MKNEIKDKKIVNEETSKEEVKIKKEEKPEKIVSKKKLPLWNFPLKGRSVRAKNLQEAIKKLNL